MALRQTFGVGHEHIDVRKIRMLLGINQVGDQKARPGIAGLRIGHEENVVRKHAEVAPRIMKSEKLFPTCDQTLDHAGAPKRSRFHSEISFAVALGATLRPSN